MINNNDPEREDIVAVVDKINDTFWETIVTNGLDLAHITVAEYLESNGQMMIKLLGNIVWDSVDDIRDYEDDDCEIKEDLYHFVMTQLGELATALGNLSNGGEKIMNRCDPVTMRNNLLMVDSFKDAGIDFVPTIVKSKEHKIQLVSAVIAELDKLEEELG